MPDCTFTTQSVDTRMDFFPTEGTTKERERAIVVTFLPTCVRLNVGEVQFTLSHEEMRRLQYLLHPTQKCVC